MNVIHKVTLQIIDEQVVSLPVGSALLDAQFQGDALNLWYARNVGSIEEEEVTVYVIGTGNEFPDTFPGKYFKTVQQGPLVWHVFFKPLAPRPQPKPIIAPTDDGAPTGERGGAH